MALETHQRRKVWIVLSDLFLDTEHDDSHLHHIASVLASSGYTWEELDRILRFELAPFLGVFPASAVGVWEGFDPDLVCENARKRLGRPSWVVRLSVLLRLQTWMVESSWQRIKHHFDTL
ncbi:MAG: hypothetical protein AAF704_16230 [Cyanobacteria bacterium P01_D01_bin.123]